MGSKDNLSDEIVPHFVRCRHPKVQYDCAQARHSVIVPYERPQSMSKYISYVARIDHVMSSFVFFFFSVGSSMSTFLYQFMCYSSCIGGGSKPVRIVLTLEYKYFINTLTIFFIVELLNDILNNILRKVMKCWVETRSR